MVEVLTWVGNAKKWVQSIASSVGVADANKVISTGSNGAIHPSLQGGNYSAIPSGQESSYFLNAAGNFTTPTMSVVFSSNLTLDTAAYADGDVLSDLLTVTSAVQSGAAAQIYEVSVIDKDDQKQPLELLFFDRAITLTAKNTAWAVSDADMDNFLGMVPIYSGDYVDLGGNAVATLPDLSVGIKANSGTSIYMATRSRGTGTYTANGLRIKLSIRQG